MTKTRQWSVFTALAVVIVLVVGWLALIKPQRSHAADLKTQVTTQQQANQLLQTQIAALEAEQKKLPQDQRTLQKFAVKVPNDAAEPALVRQLTAAAAAAGVDLVSITPGIAAAVVLTPPTTAATPAAGSSPATDGTAAAGSTDAGATPTVPVGPQLFELPVALGVVGSFANLESMFQQLETLPRAMMVTGWTMAPSAGTGTTPSTTAAGGTLPAGKTLSPDDLTGTLSTVIYYSPPTATQPTTGTTGTTGGTTPIPSTTPSASGSGTSS